MKLIPKKDPQKINYKIWNEHTPAENTLEVWDGEALWGGEERDRMLLVLVYNTGLEHFVKMLPEESKKELKELI